MDAKRQQLLPATFPAPEEDAVAAEPASLYAGPESAYRLAFTDTAFLLREELRPVRMQLELLKPELVQQEQGIESTIVIFGSARIQPPEEAQQSGSTRHAAGGDDAALRRAEMAVAMSRYYDEARASRARHHALAQPRHADLRRHRRRPRHHGSRQPRRARGRRQEHRAEHRAAARAGAQPLHHAGAVLPVPLLRAAQDALPDAQHRAGVLPRRLRHAGRAVRGADAGADRQEPQAPDPAVRARLLEPADRLRSTSSTPA
jgi:hypothetical protein